MLAKRSFPPPLTARMVEAGYRDAPDVDSDMAIVFVKVSLLVPACLVAVSALKLVQSTILRIAGVRIQKG